MKMALPQDEREMPPRLVALRIPAGEVMMKRLQAARQKMLVIHAQKEKLQPVVGISPFMEQEFDSNGYVDPNGAETSTRSSLTNQERTLTL